MFRRTFLKGLLGTVAALFTFKTKATATVALGEPARLLPEGFVVEPEWCPKGWIPVMGQTITPKQFPQLFEPQPIEGVPGRTFIPPYWKQTSAILSDCRPKALTDLQKAGIWEYGYPLTRHPPREDTHVVVKCIATEPQKWPNGRISPPGFISTTMVKKEDFEKYYGPVSKPPKYNDGMYICGEESSWRKVVYYE